MHMRLRILHAAGGAHPEARHARHEEQQAPVAGAHCAYRLPPAPGALGQRACRTCGFAGSARAELREQNFELAHDPSAAAGTSCDRLAAPHLVPGQAALRAPYSCEPGCWPLHKRGKCTPPKSISLAGRTAGARRCARASSSVPTSGARVRGRSSKPGLPRLLDPPGSSRWPTRQGCGPASTASIMCAARHT